MLTPKKKRKMDDQLYTRLQSSWEYGLKSGLNFLAGLILLALILAGCQASTAKNALQDGTYKSPSFEEFTLNLKGGEYSVFARVKTDLIPLEEGSYTIDRDKITFNVEKNPYLGPDGCSKFTQPYTYLWAFDAKTQELTLKSIDDPCSNRVSHFIAGPFVYSK